MTAALGNTDKTTPGYMLPTNRTARRYLSVALAFLVVGAFWLAHQVFQHGSIRASMDPTRYGNLLNFGHGSSASNVSSSHYTSTIVLGRLNKDSEGVAWVSKLKDITTEAIYVVDDVHAPLHLQENHGREAMVYLQYILEHYDSLTDINFFFHSHATTWHNNLLLREDSATTINMMKRDYIMEKGYVNSRCDTSPGCPKWIKFDPTPGDHSLHPLRFADMFTPERWASFFPDADDLPRYLSAPCCSQFAVTRDTIRSRPKETYQRLHDWIQSDPFDGYSGRFMEYTWQYLFLGKEEVCPDISECYCKLYGLCVQDHGLLERWQSHVYRADELSGQVASIEQRIKADNAAANPFQDSEYQAVTGRKTHNEQKAEELGKAVFDQFAIPSLRDP